jgi:predicted Rossmann fold flavoprotein
MATGGKSYPATGSTGDGYQMAAACGHQIMPLRPALVPLHCRENYISRLKGLRLKNVRVKAESEGNVIADLFGELEFTGNGISGPLVLTLSRMAGNVILTGNRIRVIIDLKPALSELKLEARLLRDLTEKKHQGFSSLLRGLLPAQLTGVFCNLLNIPESYSNAAIDASQRKSIIALLKAMPLSISGTGDYKEAVITAGGVNTSEVNPMTMESKIIKNLYFTGEVLDLDADTGGYNLQIAFSTGFVAGNVV